MLPYIGVAVVFSADGRFCIKLAPNISITKSGQCLRLVGNIVRLIVSVI